MRFAVNVAFLFTERAYLERFEATAAAGFAAVELPWPQHDLADVAAAIRAAGLELVQLNAHAGDLADGDRGYANDPRRVDEWRRAVDAALTWGFELGRPRCNLLVGNRLAEVTEDVQWATLRDNLTWALGRAEDLGTDLLVEVLNDRDTPDYLLTGLGAAARLLRDVEHPRLRLQFDTYHVGIMEGELPPAYASVRDLVGHVQLAEPRGRHEPGTGDAVVPAFLDALAARSYRGAVSLEYHPATTTQESLGWLPEPLRGVDLTAFDGLRFE